MDEGQLIVHRTPGLTLYVGHRKPTVREKGEERMEGMAKIGDGRDERKGRKNYRETHLKDHIRGETFVQKTWYMAWSTRAPYKPRSLFASSSFTMRGASVE